MFAAVSCAASRAGRDVATERVHSALDSDRRGRVDLGGGDIGGRRRPTPVPTTPPSVSCSRKRMKRSSTSTARAARTRASRGRGRPMRRRPASPFCFATARASGMATRRARATSSLRGGDGAASADSGQIARRLADATTIVDDHTLIVSLPDTAWLVLAEPGARRLSCGGGIAVARRLRTVSRRRVGADVGRSSWSWRWSRRTRAARRASRSGPTRATPSTPASTCCSPPTRRR